MKTIFFFQTQQISDDPILFDEFKKQISNLSFGICVATVKNIIRQNKKAALQEFLFGSKRVVSNAYSDSIKDLEKQIQNLQNQVNSLQQKVIHLEAKLENPKYALRSQNKAPDDTKTIKQGDSTLKPNMSSYL